MPGYYSLVLEYHQHSITYLVRTFAVPSGTVRRVAGVLIRARIAHTIVVASYRKEKKKDDFLGVVYSAAAEDVHTSVAIVVAALLRDV